MQHRKPFSLDLFAWSWPLAKYHLLGWALYTALFYGVNQLNEGAPSLFAILLLTPMAMLVMYGVVAALRVASKQATPVRRWATGVALVAIALLLTPLAAYVYVYGLMTAMGAEIQANDVPFSLGEFIKNNLLGFARYATYAVAYFSVGRWLNAQQAYYEAKEANMRHKLDLLEARNEKQAHELAALQMQLSPHLQHALFNKLYGWAMRGDAQLPDAILLLADITAYATKAAQPNHALVPVEQELGIIRKLATLTGHAPARDTAQQYMEDGATQQQPVPRLSLVTLFENAVKYADTRVGQPPIALTLDIRHAPAKLAFTCINKIGAAARHEASLGTGLANLRRRLDLLFSKQATLRTRSENGFFHACLEIEYPMRQ